MNRYAHVRFVQRVRRAYDELIANGETLPEFSEAAGRMVDALYGVVPSARAVGVPRLSLVEATEEVFQRSVDMGATKLAVPTRTRWTRVTRGRLNYDDAMAASEEWAERIERYANGQPRALIIQCSVLGGILTGAEDP